MFKWWDSMEEQRGTTFFSIQNNSLFQMFSADVVSTNGIYSNEETFFK